MNSEIIDQFVNAINEHNIPLIEALLSTDPAFADESGETISGTEKIIATWKSIFNSFPGYTIGMEKQIHHSNTIAAFGFISGSFSRNAGEHNTKWKIPAAWKIKTENGKIKLWQVYADFKIPYEIIEKYIRWIQRANATS